MAYDSKCFDLAEAFLSDEPLLNKPEYTKELAQHIQYEIESYIRWEKQRLKAPRKANTCEAGFVINSGPCKKCGATDDERCKYA